MIYYETLRFYAFPTTALAMFAPKTIMRTIATLLILFTVLASLILQVMSPYEQNLYATGLLQVNTSAALVGTGISIIALFISIINVFIVYWKQNAFGLFAKILMAFLLVVSVCQFIHWVRFYQG